jgi:hypothetical protein
MPHPFVRAFPRASTWILVTLATARLIPALIRLLWPWRRELTVVIGLLALWHLLDALPWTWLALSLYLALLAGIAAWTPARRWLLWWLRCGRTRRALIAGLAQSRSANLDGQLPRITSTRPTPVGERITLRLRPGQSYELLDARIDQLRAAVHAADVRLNLDRTRTNRLTVDVVRRDPLAATGPIPWADDDADVLSIWQPVHFGVSELGVPVRLSLPERAVLLAGNRGAGKSSGMTVFVAHAAKSPDAELLLIDANRVQLAPWAARARAFAAHDPDDAVGVVELARAELDRRLDLLVSLPGIPLGLTPELGAAHHLPLWLLFVDELAYHCSVAGTKTQQNHFYATLRDVVARGRAAGIVVIAATQRPTHDLIPTSLRDLFDIRIAYRTMTRASSDVILGDDMANRGYNATDIDLAARGVNWLLAENRDPIRTKTVWIPAESRADLAVTTVRHRPGPSAIPVTRRPIDDPEVTP